MKLSDFVSTTKQENVNNNIICIGFLDKSDPKNPDVLQPALLKQNGKDWDIVKLYDTLPSNIQEDVSPGMIATLIINDFNKEISKLSGGSLTWSQQLILIFQTRLAMVNNQFILNP